MCVFICAHSMIKGLLTRATESLRFYCQKNVNDAQLLVVATESRNRNNQQFTLNMFKIWQSVTSHGNSNRSFEQVVAEIGKISWFFRLSRRDEHTLFRFTVAKCFNTQSLVAQPPAIHASLPATESWATQSLVWMGLKVLYTLCCRYPGLIRWQLIIICIGSYGKNCNLENGFLSPVKSYFIYFLF